MEVSKLSEHKNDHISTSIDQIEVILRTIKILLNFESENVYVISKIFFIIDQLKPMSTNHSLE